MSIIRAIQAWNGSKYRDVSMDGTTRVLTTITYEHHEIHAGFSYIATDVTDLGNAAARYFLFSSSITATNTHLFFKVSHELEASLAIEEGVGVSNSGTSVTVFNRRRDSSNTNKTLLFHTPTTSSAGTVIFNSHKGAGRAEGGEVRQDSEWILLSGTNYLFTIQNETANNNVVFSSFDFYEHSDKPT